MIQGSIFVRTAGEAWQAARRAPGALAAGIVRSGPGAGRDVREWETDMASASEPDGLAAGAGALPGARRRCEAGKRTHGPGQRACLALLAATALLALAAPAQAQTEVWSATLTPGDLGMGALGCNSIDFNTAVECSNTAVLSDNDFTLGSTDHTIGFIELSAAGSLQIISTGVFTDADTLVLVLGTTSLAFSDGILGSGDPGDGQLWVSTGISWTAGTDVSVRLTTAAPPNTAPTVANTIPNQTATAGTAFSYAFLANTFADTDPGDTLTYTATQSDDTALPSWLSFAAATRTFSGMPTAADVGTVSVKVTASDGNGDSVSDTFDIVVSAAAGVTVSKSALTVTEEDTTGNTYTVVLDSQPTANVTVTVAGHAGTDVTPSPTSLTFTTTTWGTAQTVTVTAGDDADTANDTVTLTHSAASTDSNYGGITIGSVVVTVADNDSLTAPGAPTGLTATASGTTAINLSWSAPASTGGSAITGYKIEVSANGTSGWTDQVANTNSTATTYAHTGLVSGDTRHYRVSAINANGTGVPSNVDSATTGTTVPGAPTGLTATASGTTAINLSWSAPASTGGSAITGYKIEVSANGTSGWTDQVANTNSTATTYAHTGLVSGDTRHYRVSAINANGTGVPSNVDSATTASTNTAAMGAPTITGTAQVGQTLTAGTTAIMDADGLTSVSYTYQWIRVATDNTETNISSATASTYTLVAADQGTTVKVTVSFTDDANNPETRTSAATATVTATPAVPTREPFPEPEPEPEPEPVPALPLLGQLLLALGLAGAGAMRLVRAARRP